MTLVDSNILIDFVTRDPIWFERTRKTFVHRAAMGKMWIIDPVFAEVSVTFPDVPEYLKFLTLLDVARASMSEQALYFAAQAFKAYRARGGVKTNVLPDFFIGAQAQVAGWTILTRDARRYRTYFPKVRLVEPNA